VAAVELAEKSRRNRLATQLLASAMAIKMMLAWTIRQAADQTLVQAAKASVSATGALLFAEVHAVAQNTGDGGYGSVPDTSQQVTVADHAKTVIAAFESENKDATGDAYLTPGGGSRTAEVQVGIILDPKNADNYSKIKASFKKEFGLETLPASSDLTDKQKDWFVNAVNEQAGKPNGFAHVGGNAQDISVKNLTADQKEVLAKKLATDGFGVFNEKYSGSKSTYGVDIKDANLLHVYKK
jgi:hypothetical protein